MNLSPAKIQDYLAAKQILMEFAYEQRIVCPKVSEVVKEALMSDIKLTHEQTMHFQVRKQKETIRQLVELIDELRQPFNHSEHHHALYEKATTTLNRFEVEGRI